MAAVAGEHINMGERVAVEARWYLSLLWVLMAS